MKKLWSYSAVACFLLISTPVSAAPASQCYGTTGKGRLDNGVRLPSAGANFESYGQVPELAGRTFVHSKVRDSLLSAFGSLAQSHPALKFKYAETGKADGGLFPPHKTHQNGLSVDIMVPVRDATGQSVHLPTHPLNRYGYDIEFDRQGKWRKLEIDFDALGHLIVAIKQAATENEIEVRRVLFTPDLQERLYSSAVGGYIRENIQIPAKRSWVRHDEHIHVDFDVPCKPLK